MHPDSVVYSIVFLYFIVSSSEVIPVTFFPTLALKRGLNESEIGLIMSSFQIGQMISSLLLGKLMHLFKKSHLLYLSIFLLGFSNILFGFAILIDNNRLFLITSVITRLIIGFTSSATKTTVVSLILTLFPEKAN